MTEKKTDISNNTNAASAEKPTQAKKPLNGKRVQARRAPRVIRDPNQVAQLVMMQLDHVNTKKDELTVAIKGLADVTRQLARAYAQHVRVIQGLQARISKLEAKGEI